MSFILDKHSLERFKKECQWQNENLLNGKCQLCLDALLLLIKSNQHDSNDEDGEITPNPKCPLALCQDEYILQIIRKCLLVKIVFPSNRTFQGLIDLSFFESCISLELVRIPFDRIIGIERIRQNIRSLTWIRGNDEVINEAPILSSRYINFKNRQNCNDNLKPLRIDEIFWDRFGPWPSLTYLCLSRCNIAVINASTMPESIKTFNLTNNRIHHFNNLANYSTTSTITNLSLEYNSMKELPKLNTNTLSSLTRLSLRGNLLESIKGLRNFISLTHLDLSENCISDTESFLSEIAYLYPNLKVLAIEKNPIAYDPFIQCKCENILFNLIKFNGKLTKRSRKMLQSSNNQTTINSEPSLSAFADQALKLSHNIDDSIDHQVLTLIEDYEQSSSSKENFPQRSTSKLKKSKPSKERFIVINDEDLPSKDLPITIKKNRNEMNIMANTNRNLLFGGYSGSYGSSTNNFAQMTTMKNENVSENVAPVNNIEAEILITNNNDQEGEEKPPDNDVLISNISEWATEDTEESTMFLVEIYSNISEYEENIMKASSNQDNTDYYFVRIRPRDGLIYEKDCTSGKVLQTLDLKILQRYEKEMKNEIDNNQLLIVKLYFDTCINSKKERVYRFLDEKSFNTFVDMFVSKYNEYRNQYDAAIDPRQVNNNQSKLTSNNSHSGTGLSQTSMPWFYMCLRCGERAHKIITDCSKCGSDLIIRDESFHETTGKVAANNNELVDDNIRRFNLLNQQQDSGVLSSHNHHNINNEEIIDIDMPILDENYFKTDIDHYLKLHIEIYLYERMGDDEQSLQTESVEALFRCLIYDFQEKSFKPSLAALTNNYFFLFNHHNNLEQQESLLSNQKKSSGSSSSKEYSKHQDLINLICYVPLAPIMLPHNKSGNSSLILSHLPEPIKNVGYWIEYKLNSKQKKILTNLNKANNNNRSNKTNQQLLS